MKRADWRRVRGTDFGPFGNPLSTKDLAEVVDQTMTEVMWEVLRRIANHEKHAEVVDGERLSGFNTKPSTIEALWARGLVKVRWNRVPAHAPMHVRVSVVSLTERGRAAIAIVDLRRQGEVAGVDWAVPPGVTAVQVTGVGGGGGGGGGGGSATASQVAATINKAVPGVVASPVGAHGVSIGAAKKGPVGKPVRVTSPKQLAAVFGPTPSTGVLPVAPGQQLAITIGAGGRGGSGKNGK